MQDLKTCGVAIAAFIGLVFAANWFVVSEQRRHGVQQTAPRVTYTPPAAPDAHKQAVEWPIVNAALTSMRGAKRLPSEQRLALAAHYRPGKLEKYPVKNPWGSGKAPMWLWGDALIYDSDKQEICETWEGDQTCDAWRECLSRETAEPRGEPVTVFIITRRETRREVAKWQRQAAVFLDKVTIETDHIVAVYWPQGRVAACLTVRGGDLEPYAASNDALQNLEEMIMYLPRWGHPEDQDLQHSPRVYASHMSNGSRVRCRGGLCGDCN
ncbi:hypothetical protein LLH23_18505 [bacterium]|nr:hypothetical protein [bacterium]